MAQPGAMHRRARHPQSIGRNVHADRLPGLGRQPFENPPCPGADVEQIAQIINLAIICYLIKQHYSQ